MGAWFRSAIYAALLVMICWGLIPSSASAYSLIPYSQNTMAIFSFPGQRPNSLGTQAGLLTPCPNTPNCVSSQAPATDQEHSIAPIAYNGSAAEAIAKLKAIIEGSERTTIIQADSSYLYAEFASKLLGFVDDVEFYADEPAKVIHVRSASRLGQSDLGVNRQRIEALRSKLA
jgi:uncharacterized protein (DUF1499 family)